MKQTNKKPRTLFLALMLAFSLLLPAATLAEAAPAEDTPVVEAPTEEAAESQEAPGNFFLTLDLTYLDGTPFDVSAFDGKPIFLNIWATWCPPCLEEMPHLEELYKEYGDRINIVGLHAEGLTVTQEGAFVPNEEKNTLALELKEEMNLTYPLINPDTNLFIIMNVPDYGLQVSVLPTTWFIDGKGTFRNVVEGYRDLEGWKQQIEGFLNLLEGEEDAKTDG